MEGRYRNAMLNATRLPGNLFAVSRVASIGRAIQEAVGDATPASWQRASSVATELSSTRKWSELQNCGFNQKTRKGLAWEKWKQTTNPQGIREKRKLGKCYFSKKSLLKMKWWSKKGWVEAPVTENLDQKESWLWRRNQARTLRSCLRKNALNFGAWDSATWKLSLTGWAPNRVRSCALQGVHREGLSSLGQRQQSPQWDLALLQAISVRCLATCRLGRSHPHWRETWKGSCLYRRTLGLVSHYISGSEQFSSWVPPGQLHLKLLIPPTLLGAGYVSFLGHLFFLCWWWLKPHLGDIRGSLKRIEIESNVH